MLFLPGAHFHQRFKMRGVYGSMEKSCFIPKMETISITFERNLFVNAYHLVNRNTIHLKAYILWTIHIRVVHLKCELEVDFDQYVN